MYNESRPVLVIVKAAVISARAMAGSGYAIAGQGPTAVRSRFAVKVFRAQWTIGLWGEIACSRGVADDARVGLECEPGEREVHAMRDWLKSLSLSFAVDG